MLTFWGRPRNVRIYAGARETPITWGPLIVLSVLAILSGRLMNVTEMLDGSVHENTAYCRSIDPAFAGFDTAWPAPVAADDSIPIDTRDPTEVVATTATATTTAAVTAASRGSTPSQIARARGTLLLDHWLGAWGPLVGLVLAAILYAGGPGPARFLCMLWPIRPVRDWLYHRMYFDELYFAAIIAPTVWIARLIARADRRILDRAVHAAAALTRRLARRVHQFDVTWIDGAVAGIGTTGIGTGTAAIQTGRIRGYLRVLAIATASAVALVGAIYLTG
jgi:NADH:ubiquinone oxidoreductase subunit 5 (subunit L)/multisubunit Na+/H+ antiporter MnhA subunit